MKIYLIVWALLLSGLLSCSRSSTETGNPGVTLEFSDFDQNTASHLKSSGVNISSVEELYFCFKRLRFKRGDDQGGEIDENLDLELGVVNLSPGGTTLGTFELPEGIYRRIEFDLEPNCMNQNSPSVYLDNGNGGGSPFQTEEDIKIRFEGETYIGSNDTVKLAIGNMIDALNAVNNSNEIKDALEGVPATGEF